MSIPITPARKEVSTRWLSQLSATAWIWASVAFPLLRHFARSAARRCSTVAPAGGTIPATRSSTGRFQVTRSRDIWLGRERITPPCRSIGT